MKAEDIVFGYLNKGLSDIGIAKAESFEELRSEFEKYRLALAGFVEQDIEKRIYPDITMPSVKSVIAAAIPYIKRLPEKDAKLRVDISMGAVGEDYHFYLKRILDGLAQELENEFGCECMTFVDTGSLSDRAVAVKCGIGYIGKNGSLVAKNGGSGVFLGYILTDMELCGNEPCEESCGKCRKCVESCPTGAINGEGFCLEKCISYITQKKGVLSLEEMALMGRNIYGCDVCHRVCPKTRVIDEVLEIDDVFPEAEYILNMDNRGFREKYGRTAMSFRGRNIIRRNALCALANIGTKESMEIIEKYLDDDSAMIKQTAEKAILTVKNSLEK